MSAAFITQQNRKPVFWLPAHILQKKGVEPSRYYYHTDLNRARLPIPPLLHFLFLLFSSNSYWLSQQRRLLYRIAADLSTTFLTFLRHFLTDFLPLFSLYYLPCSVINIASHQSNSSISSQTLSLVISIAFKLYAMSCILPPSNSFPASSASVSLSWIQSRYPLPHPNCQILSHKAIRMD